MAYCVGNDCYAQVTENILFTDTSVGGTFTSWNWNFGDGTSSTLQNPSHPYGTAGNYIATHTATDSCGTCPGISKTIYVTSTPPPPPPSAIPMEFLALAGLGALGIIYLSQIQPTKK